MALPLDDERLSKSLDETIQRRVDFLSDYQNAAYAARYQALVDEVRSAEQALRYLGDFIRLAGEYHAGDPPMSASRAH